MTPIGPIDQLGNRLEQGLYMHQKSRRVVLVTHVDGNSYTIKYFPGLDGNSRVPARYLTPFTPEMATNFLQQRDSIVWLSDQIRERPDLRRAVTRSLESRTKKT